MSKQAFLQKLLVKEAAIALAVIVVTVGMMEVTGGIEMDSANSLRQTTSQLNSTSSQLTTMRGQIDKSGSAEKRYVNIRLQRDQEDYAPDNELMRDRLKILKEKYRLGNDLRLALSPEAAPNIREFSPLNHNVLVREKMELSFSAMSDIHVFSFLDEFQRTMPGVVRLIGVSIKRDKDINVSILSQMTSGKSPSVVSAKITFLWATLTPKTEGAR